MSTQGALAPEHVSMQGTLARKQISMQDTIARENTRQVGTGALKARNLADLKRNDLT